MLLATLVFIAVVLTCAMFVTKQSMLGFPSGIFWFVAGAQSYTLITGAPWVDIYFYIFFACSVGMTLFTILAAFGLRNKDNESAGDEQRYYGESRRKTMSPDKKDEEQENAGIDDGFNTTESRQTRELRERANERRTQHGIRIVKEERKKEPLKWS